MLRRFARGAAESLEMLWNFEQLAQHKKALATVLRSKIILLLQSLIDGWGTRI
jgi:hypothetical protein